MLLQDCSGSLAPPPPAQSWPLDDTSLVLTALFLFRAVAVLPLPGGIDDFCGGSCRALRNGELICDACRPVTRPVDVCRRFSVKTGIRLTRAAVGVLRYDM